MGTDLAVRNFARALAFAALLVAAPAAAREAAPLQMKTLEGRSVSLEDLRGDVVVLNFWATWCKPCEDEMPAMERLYRAYHAQGFELLAVSVDVGSDEVVAFRDRLALSFPILHDPDRKVSSKYHALRFPESWLIAPDGTLAARFIGPRDWDAPEYAAKVRELLPGGATAQ
jgi:peroxiredoxin